MSNETTESFQAFFSLLVAHCPLLYNRATIRTSKMSLSGNLNTMSFGDLLQFIAANQSTGTLQIRRSQILKMIFFEKGRIISSSSSDPKDYLGHFLVSQAIITEEELRIAMEIQRSSKMMLGKILVMGGKVKEEDMVHFLQMKTEETIYTLFLWDEGEFTFYADEFINRIFVRISLDPQAMIFEGVLRRDEWERMRKIFPNNSFVLEREPGVELALEETDPQTKLIYTNIDGKRTIDDIATAVHGVEYTVCRVLFGLLEAGYIRIAKIAQQPQEPQIRGGVHSMSQLIAEAKQKLVKGRPEEALDLLKEIEPQSGEYLPEVIPLLDQAEKDVIREMYTRYLPADRIPHVVIPFEELGTVQLTPQEGFILSRLDGIWDVRSIVSITPIKEVEALRLLKRLIDRGIVGLKEE
jgi:DNA-binding Lrp family transcriptional regulator